MAPQLILYFESCGLEIERFSEARYTTPDSILQPRVRMRQHHQFAHYKTQQQEAALSHVGQALNATLKCQRFGLAGLEPNGSLVQPFVLAQQEISRLHFEFAQTCMHTCRGREEEDEGLSVFVGLVDRIYKESKE